MLKSTEMRLKVLKIAVFALVGVALALSVTVYRPMTATASGSPGTVTYSYDSVGNLVQDLYPANNLTYSYDAAGNRQTSQTQ